MNGRVYDYQLGRFLSVDPIIGNALNSQSLNPYSYIGNNPLSGTDPTGYFTCTGSHVNYTSGSCQDHGVQGGSTTQGNREIDQRTAAASRSNGASSGQGTQTRTAEQQSPSNLGNPTVQAPKVAGQGSDAPTNSGGDDGSATALAPVQVTARAGAYLNADEEATVRRLSFNDVQAGKDANNETMVFINTKGTVLSKTQNGCRGAEDRCSADPQIGTTVIGHTHIYPAIPSGVDAATKRIKELSRDMPGFGDAASLSQGVPGAVWTRGGYKFAIEGTFQSPTVRYLEGGQPSFGHYVEQHWRPNDNQLLFNIATDYLRDNRR